ncbi:MAG TPA: carbonic anhydrase [Pirellulaceae bacterium]|nr:carbonic anhydrase [Pirellulaceae bacterium]HMO92892.1 carbonic anhydrase [Pirellulaceae bacterium]HMP69170.1 carbonic anhydrase [Pirellulaceae bacterium]
MQKLIQGIHKFQQNIFDDQKVLFARLAKGQQPLALFITCSDSRIDPNMLTQTKPGELFIIRNAGNLIPPHGVVTGGEAGTIEYAISVLKIKDVIVCGHSMCGAMAGVLHPEQLDGLNAVKNWLSYADATARVIKENYSHLTDETARLMATVEENVLIQLENLRTHPSVAAALARDELKLHAWVYKFETGQVFSYVPENNEFSLLEESHGIVQSGRKPIPSI